MWRDKFGLKSSCTAVSRQAVLEVDIIEVYVCVCALFWISLPIKMALLVNLLVILRETPQNF